MSAALHAYALYIYCMAVINLLLDAGALHIATTAPSGSSQPVYQNNGKDCLIFTLEHSYSDFQYPICLYREAIELKMLS